jgi:hypothetical protein
MEGLKTYLLLVFIAVISILHADAQTLVIRSNDGIENSKVLNSLKKFSFVNNSLLLSYIDGSTESFSIPTINKLYFESVPVGINSLLTNTTDTQISVFPNPVGSTLYLKNNSYISSTLYIYRIDGAVVYTYPVSVDKNSFDISKLNPGLYILKINNQTIKFMKS